MCADQVLFRERVHPSSSVNVGPLCQTGYKGKPPVSLFSLNLLSERPLRLVSGVGIVSVFCTIRNPRTNLDPVRHGHQHRTGSNGSAEDVKEENKRPEYRRQPSVIGLHLHLLLLHLLFLHSPSYCSPLRSLISPDLPALRLTRSPGGGALLSTSAAVFHPTFNENSSRSAALRPSNHKPIPKTASSA